MATEDVIETAANASVVGYVVLETSTAFQETTNHSEMLQVLNDEMALTLVPAMTFVGVLMITGFIGNVLVCYIFSTKLRQSTQNYLFVVLAIFDLMSCIIAMPTEIVDMRLYYMFHSEIACKCLRVLVSFPTLASNIVLLVIAVDRYRKVCKPLYDQITKHIAKIAAVVAAVVSLTSSVPAYFIYGRRSAQTRVHGVVGSDCSVSDNMAGKIYPLVYEVTLGTFFFIFTAALIILYILIWREIQRHKKYMKKNANYTMLLLMSRDRSGDSDPPSSPATPRSRSHSHDTSTVTPQPPLSYRAQRTTVIAFLVTSVFILSFVPHLCLVFARIAKKDIDHNLQGYKLTLYNIGIRSYFVNSVANPIIYGAMNFHFRRACVKSLKSLCNCYKGRK